MVGLLVRFLPFLFRSNSSKGLGFTGWGYLVVGVAAILSVLYAKNKVEDWYQDRDESRKVSAVIESNKKTVDNVNQFQKDVEDGKGKIGTPDIFDAIN